MKFLSASLMGLLAFYVAVCVTDGKSNAEEPNEYSKTTPVAVKRTSDDDNDPQMMKRWTGEKNLCNRQIQDARDGVCVATRGAEDALGFLKQEIVKRNYPYLLNEECCQEGCDMEEVSETC